MKPYIALIRGINVGGRNSLPMKELKGVFEAQGFSDVQTYIQSGNVVFQSQTELRQRDSNSLAKAILKMKGFEPQVLIINHDQFQNAIEDNPFPTDQGKALHLFFLESQPEHPDLDKLLSLKTESEEFELVGSVFYLFAPDGLGRSKLAVAVEKNLGVPATARNWNTIRQLALMTGASYPVS